MPFTEVMHKWATGKLHSGSKSGPRVTSQAQAVAIMLSEKRTAAKGKREYRGKIHNHKLVSIAKLRG
jgi:Family of unknown function (DUF6496)